VVIFVNSKQQEIAADSSLEKLVELLGMQEKKVAIEVNTELVTRGQWREFKLTEGDRIEIVTFVGGG